MSEIQRCRRFPNLFCKRLVVLSDKENVRILNVPESQRNLFFSFHLFIVFSSPFVCCKLVLGILM